MLQETKDKDILLKEIQALIAEKEQRKKKVMENFNSYMTKQLNHATNVMISGNQQKKDPNWNKWSQPEQEKPTE